MNKLSKRKKSFQNIVESERLYNLTEAISLLKKIKPTKFDESVDVALRLGIDTRKAEQMVRGTCSMPNGLGKKIRVMVFAKADKAIAAEEAGADYVGGEDYAKKIQEGWLEFDRVVATPDMMAVVGRIGKILGPRGLMPNPKSGTVTMDVVRAVKDLKAGQVELRVESNGIIHVSCGKVSFQKEQLVENVAKIHDAIMKARPSSVKGQYLEKVVISSTMGPSIIIDHLAIG